MVSNLKTKLATVVLLAMTLIALSIPVMATVCQYGGDDVASDCIVDDEVGDICDLATLTALEEAPVCDEVGDACEEIPVEDDCEVVDEAIVEDVCGPVTIGVQETECVQAEDPCEDVDKSAIAEDVCDADEEVCDEIMEVDDSCDDCEATDEDECDTAIEEDDTCDDMEESDDECPTNTVCNASKTYKKICNGSQTYNCPTKSSMPPCIPSLPN